MSAKLAPCWVVWSVIWSVGATCDHSGRARFSDFMRKLMEEEGTKPPFPPEGSVYDYTLVLHGYNIYTYCI